MQKDSDGKLLKVIRILFQGVFMSFTQISATEYTFMMTDYYETLNLSSRTQKRVMYLGMTLKFIDRISAVGLLY
jgi:hypothetical protein